MSKSEPSTTPFKSVAGKGIHVNNVVNLVDQETCREYQAFINRG